MLVVASCDVGGCTPGGMGKSRLYARAGITKTAAEKTFKALLKGIEGAVVKGDKVLFTGFGSFEKVVRSARAGRNIQTGEAVTYPASNVRLTKAVI